MQGLAQLTLIALYGDKAPPFAALIRDLQRMVSAASASFAPYAIAQVHGTIVGLERAGSDRHANQNFERFRGVTRTMQLAEWLAHVRKSSQWPMRIGFGGFAPGASPFLSRGLEPYARSFSVQGEKVVLIGWPVHARGYPAALLELRQAAEPFGILHAYHRTPADRDNDFYVRLGLLQSPLSERVQRDLELQAREYLARAAPCYVDIDRSDLKLAAYTDARLPIDSTRVQRIDDPRLTPAYLADL